MHTRVRFVDTRPITRSMRRGAPKAALRTAIIAASWSTDADPPRMWICDSGRHDRLVRAAAHGPQRCYCATSMACILSPKIGSRMA